MAEEATGSKSKKEIVDKAKDMANKYASNDQWYRGYRNALYELLAWIEDVSS